MYSLDEIICPTTLQETTDPITDYIGPSCSDDEVLRYCFVAIEHNNMRLSAYSLQTLAERGAQDCFITALTAALVEKSFLTDKRFYLMVRDALERNYERLELQDVWEEFSQIEWDPEATIELLKGADSAGKKCPRPYEV